MPKSSRGIGSTPPNASLISGPEAVCLEHASSIKERHSLYAQGEGTLSGIESKHSKERIISNPRVAVLASDGESSECTRRMPINSLIGGFT